MVALGLAAAPPALAETLVVSGVPLELSAPSGYCRLSPDVPTEAAVARQLAQAEKDTLRPALAFADCLELEDWRAGRRRDLTTLGQIGGQVVGGEVQRADSIPVFFRDLRGRLPRLSAAEAVALPGQDGLLVEGAGFAVHGGLVERGRAAELHLGATTVIGGAIVEISIYMPASPTGADNAARLAEGAGSLAQGTGEMLAMNDVFDEAEKPSNYNQAGSLNQLTAIVAGLSLISLLGIRSLWLLLRAPRRRQV
ncbi:hypothetical protein DKG74_15555 [Zavarzinia aquatilis]|uniref:Uncharacterized protein n=2 Tax=Zavarzinia aquatilis TaxID=2211142 RepID=A0A317E018_9PROT|nr:hypothetical protein DKG74_15555 [Zavarzinia aquatilis]